MSISDAARVTLITETLDGSTPQRRRAARILLEWSRAEAAGEGRDAALRTVREQAGAAVAAEVSSLIDLLGMGGERASRREPEAGSQPLSCRSR